MPRLLRQCTTALEATSGRSGVEASDLGGGYGVLSLVGTTLVAAQLIVSPI